MIDVLGSDKQCAHDRNWTKCVLPCTVGTNNLFQIFDTSLDILLNVDVCILLRVLVQVQGFPSNATLFQ
jgi:hypothetical protein